MKLYAVERAAGEDGCHLRIDEHADRVYERRKLGDDLGGLRRRDLPRAGREDEPARVGARFDRCQRVLSIRDAADLYSHEWSSRVFAATSRSRTTASPTRTSSTPQAATLATSAALFLPLSL